MPYVTPETRERAQKYIADLERAVATTPGLVTKTRLECARIKMRFYTLLDEIEEHLVLTTPPNPHTTCEQIAALLKALKGEADAMPEGVELTDRGQQNPDAVIKKVGPVLAKLEPLAKRGRELLTVLQEAQKQ